MNWNDCPDLKMLKRELMRLFSEVGLLVVLRVGEVVAAVVVPVSVDMIQVLLIVGDTTGAEDEGEEGIDRNHHLSILFSYVFSFLFLWIFHIIIIMSRTGQKLVCWSRRTNYFRGEPTSYNN